ncbi:MAG: hypothetical protein M3P10_10700 [Actinomycetota bacterium]|nr:hypothetical protein [Actinomycetota bacterium]
MANAQPYTSYVQGTHLHRDFDVLVVRIAAEPTTDELAVVFEAIMREVESGANRVVVAGKAMRDPSPELSAFRRTLQERLTSRGMQVTSPHPDQVPRTG